MESAASTAPSASEGGKQTRQAAYNKNEKTKDVRTTNIQAAKGNLLPAQPLQTASAPPSAQEAWTK